MKLSLSLLSGIVLSQSMHAAILVKYDFNSAVAGTSPSVENVTTQIPTITRGPFMEQMSVQTNGTLPGTLWQTWDGNFMRARVKRDLANQVFMTTVDVAAANGAFIAFSYTPTESVDFGSFQFEAATRQGSPGVPLPVGLTLRSSLTGNLNLGATNVISAIAENASFQSINIDLSGYSALQNVTTPVTFYLYGDTQGTNTQRDFLIDNITINSIPEPTALGLLGIGGMSLTLLRRRNRSQG